MRVFFFQPKAFNRTERRTNPFFDPIIKVCADNGIEYRIYQPYRKNESGYAKMYSSKCLRKFVCMVKWLVRIFTERFTEVEQERIAGRIWNWLTFGRYKADIYITIACEFSGVLRGINPHAKVVDVQHGLFCRQHWGYLNRDGTIADFLRQFPEREIWVAGEGYREILLQRPENREWVGEHVRVGGDFLGHELTQSWVDASDRDGCILFSLQLTGELTDDGNVKVFEQVRKVLREIKDGGVDCAKIVLRHHPRYKGFPDVAPLFEEFPGIRVSGDPLKTILEKTLIHVTLTSTTAFEAAAGGVPTYIPRSYKECFLSEDFDWHEDFQYPFWNLSFGELMRLVRQSRQEVVDAMHNWFRKYYQPINESHILKLLRA